MPRGLSERAHQKVLDAAAELFAERGIDATSMDAIAAASGVSKATVYKHWADKDALCLEVLLHAHRFDEEQQQLETGNLKTDLKAVLGHEPPGETTELRRRLWPHLMAYSAKHEEFGRVWRTRVAEHAQAGLRNVLRRGIEEGVFPLVLDEELAIAMLMGPMMYRHIFRPTVNRDWLIEGVVEVFWKAHARTPPGHAARTKNVRKRSRAKR